MKRGLRVGAAVVLMLASAVVVPVAAEEPVSKKLFVQPPPFTPGIFPCSQCHAGMEPNRTPRKLEGMHQDIVLKHMPGGWCFDCHNPANRDKLRLANG